MKYRPLNKVHLAMGAGGGFFASVAILPQPCWAVSVDWGGPFPGCLHNKREPCYFGVSIRAAAFWKLPVGRFLGMPRLQKRAYSNSPHTLHSG